MGEVGVAVTSVGLVTAWHSTRSSWSRPSAGLAAHVPDTLFKKTFFQSRLWILFLRGGGNTCTLTMPVSSKTTGPRRMWTQKYV